MSISSVSYLGVFDVYYDFGLQSPSDVSHTVAYLRTYDIVHGGLIAAAQMRAVEADHNQTAVEGLGSKDESRSINSRKNIVSPRRTLIIFCLHEKINI